MTKQLYYRTLTILISIIILLTVFLIALWNNPIEVTKEIIVEVEKEVIVEKEIEVEKEIIIEVEKAPTYAYNISSTDREMIARLLFLEGNTQSFECQKAIVSVIINRWKSPYWGTTIKETIYANGQFTPAVKISTTTPTETNYKAVDEVLKNGCTLPPYVLYFRAAYHHEWKGYSPYTHMDNTYFGYMTKDKK